MIRPSPTTLRLLARGTNLTTKRPLSSSLRTSLRTAARNMESHPFERLPGSTKTQGGDWGKIGRRVGVQAALFFPGMATILGWPLLAKMAFDESDGYEIPDHLRLGYGWDS